MDETRAAILLLNAIAGGIRQAPGPEGDDRIVAVSNDPMAVTTAMHAIAQTLDWRVVVIDAVRTNFNDLEAEGSPLLDTVRRARDSDIQHVVVVQNAVPALLTESRYRSHLSYMSYDLPTVLCMTEVPDDTPDKPNPWTVVDLRDTH